MTTEIELRASLTDEDLALIDKLAVSEGSSRHDLLVRVIGLGLDALEARLKPRQGSDGGTGDSG